MKVSSSISNDSSLKQKNVKPSEYEDPKFREFLQIMQPRSKQKMWAKDTSAPSDARANDTSAPSDAIVKDGNADQEQIETVKGISLSRGERESSETVDREQLNGDDDTTDMEYFKSRVKANWSDSEDSETEGEASDGEPSKSDVNDETIDMSGIDQAQMQEEPSKTFIEENNDNEIPNSSFNDDYKLELETGRLFIRNLPYTATYGEVL